MGWHSLLLPRWALLGHTNFPLLNTLHMATSSSLQAKARLSIQLLLC